LSFCKDWQAWNKGLEVGKRDGFTPAQVKQIRGLLTDRGTPGLRDLALFSTAIDTMLHAHAGIYLKQPAYSRSFQGIKRT